MKEQRHHSFFFAIPFCLAGLTLCSSCTEKGKNNSPEEMLIADLKNTDMNLSEWNLDTRILFKYKSQDEALECSDRVINTIIDKMKNELFSRADGTTNIITEINFNNGEALLTEIYILNVDNHEVFEGGVLVQDEDDFKQLSPLEWEALGRSTGCSTGYTQIARCATNLMPRNLNEPLSNQLSQYLNAGKNIKIQINVGVVDTAICLNIAQ